MNITFRIHWLNKYSDQYRVLKLADNQRRTSSIHTKEELAGRHWSRWFFYRREHLTADYWWEDSSILGQFLRTEKLAYFVTVFCVVLPIVKQSHIKYKLKRMYTSDQGTEWILNTRLNWAELIYSMIHFISFFYLSVLKAMDIEEGLWDLLNGFFKRTCAFVLPFREGLEIL